MYWESISAHCDDLGIVLARPDTEYGIFHQWVNGGRVLQVGSLAVVTGLSTLEGSLVYRKHDIVRENTTFDPVTGTYHMTRGTGIHLIPGSASGQTISDHVAELHSQTVLDRIQEFDPHAL